MVDDVVTEEDFQKIGGRYANAVRMKIASNTPPPNAPSTIDRKGHGQTLIDSGDLIMNVEFHVEYTHENITDIYIGIFDEKIATYGYWNEMGIKRPERSFMRSTFYDKMDEVTNEFAESISKRIEDIFMNM